MNTKLDIRPLQSIAEAEFCARIMAESEPWITLKRGYEAGLALVQNPTREVYIAQTEAGEPAGFVVLNMQGAFVGYLQTICVAPNYRNLGIGRALIAFAEARIFRDSPNMFLCVSSFNPDAQRLYQRLGFEVVGALKNYLVDGLDEILMRKTTGPLVGFHKR